MVKKHVYCVCLFRSISIFFIWYGATYEINLLEIILISVIVYVYTISIELFNSRPKYVGFVCVYSVNCKKKIFDIDQHMKLTLCRWLCLVYIHIVLYYWTGILSNIYYAVNMWIYVATRLVLFLDVSTDLWDDE